MRYKLDSLLPDCAFSPEIRSPLGSRMRLHGGDGGGGQQPTTTTTNTSNLPEYARPNVEQMLNAASKLIYVDKDGKQTFRDFKPYSDDPTKYFAGPSGGQIAAYNQAMGLRNPYQFNQASRQTNRAGQTALAGQGRYERGATNPGTVGAFMSPYMQNAVDVQKQQAMRDYYQTQLPNLDAQAARAGAFGGSRHGVAQAMAQQDLNRNLQNIQATGTEKAFENAQRAQQFGAELGMKGAQTGTQAAQNLANIGNQQQQANLARINTIDTLGAKQQAYQQGIINQAIQNYATQQQNPYMQLSFMNSLLRGLPLQNVTTQSYQAQPNLASQIAGFTGAGIGAAKAFGKKGGLVKGLAAGGMPDTSGAANAASARVPAPQMQADLKMMATPYLKMLNAKLPPNSPLKGQVEAELAIRDRTAMMAKMAPPSLEMPPQGIDQMPSGLPQMKDGGIVGYAEGKSVKPEDNDYLKRVQAVHEFGGNLMDALTTPANWNPITKSYDFYQTLIGKPFERVLKEPLEKQKERWDAGVNARKNRSFTNTTPPPAKPASGAPAVAPNPDIEFNPDGTTKPHRSHITLQERIPPEPPRLPPVPELRTGVPSMKSVLTKAGPEPTTTAEGKNEYEQMLRDSLESSKAEAEKDKWFRLMQAGLGVMAQPGPNFLQNIALGSQQALKDLGEDRVRSRKEKRELLKDLYGISDKQLDRQLKREEMNINQYFKKVELELYQQRTAAELRPRDFEVASNLYADAQRLLASKNKEDQELGKQKMERFNAVFGRQKTGALSSKDMFDAYNKMIADGVTPEEALRRVQEGSIIFGGGGFQLPKDVTVKQTR